MQRLEGRLKTNCKLLFSQSSLPLEIKKTTFLQLLRTMRTHFPTQLLYHQRVKRGAHAWVYFEALILVPSTALPPNFAWNMGGSCCFKMNCLIEGVGVKALWELFAGFPVASIFSIRINNVLDNSSLIESWNITGFIKLSVEMKYEVSLVISPRNYFKASLQTKDPLSKKPQLPE